MKDNVKTQNDIEDEQEDYLDKVNFLAEEKVKSLSDIQKEEWKKAEQLPDIPILTDGDYTDCLEQADVLLTTDELPGNPVKQFFIPMVPLAGTDGELIVMRTIYRLLCRYGNKGGIAYA